MFGEENRLLLNKKQLTPKDIESKPLINEQFRTAFNFERIKKST